jgi:signal transduction histidine kinase
MAAAAILLAVVVQLLAPAPVSTLRYTWFDLLQTLFDAPESSAPLTIVDIDEASIKANGQWPWPRDRIAASITALALDRASVVGVSVIFPEPDRLSPENVLRDAPVPQELLDGLRLLPSNDASLAESMRLVPTVLANAAVADQSTTSAGAGATTPIELRVGAQFSSRLSRYPGALKNLPQLEAASAGSGIASIDLDRDGVIRRLPTVMLVGEAVVPSFGVEIVRIFRKAAAIGVEVDGSGVDGVSIGDRFLATDSGGSVWLRHVSPDSFRRLSATDVLLGNHSREAVEGRIVLLGATGAGLERTFVSAGGLAMSALDVQAQFVENLLSGIYLTRSQVTLFTEILATVIGCLGVILLRGRLRSYPGQLVVLAYVVSLFALSLYAFDARRTYFDPMFPEIAIIVCYLGLIGAEIVRTQREQRKSAAERETALILAEAASRSKTNFLASMSHELRTPLNAILGFSEMIKDGALGPVTPSKYASYASDIHGSATQLLDMVTQILSMAELEAGEVHLRVSDFDLKELVRESIAAALPSKGARNAIEFDDQHPMPHLRADRKMVEQMLRNLLQNAVKFSSPGTPVQIAGRDEGDGGYVVSVTDSGSGMNRRQVAEAFEMFQVSDQSISNNVRGIGLGLPMTTALMALHGGRMAVSSEIGSGAKVALHFPAHRVLRSVRD